MSPSVATSPAFIGALTILLSSAPVRVSRSNSAFASRCNCPSCFFRSAVARWFASFSIVFTSSSIAVLVSSLMPCSE